MELRESFCFLIVLLLIKTTEQTYNQSVLQNATGHYSTKWSRDEATIKVFVAAITFVVVLIYACCRCCYSCIKKESSLPPTRPLRSSLDHGFPPSLVIPLPYEPIDGSNFPTYFLGNTMVKENGGNDSLPTYEECESFPPDYERLTRY